MFRLFAKSMLLLALVALVLVVGAFWPVLRHRYANSETTSDLLIMPRDTEEGVVMLGTSHGRIFSMTGNHAKVEGILGIRFLNLSLLRKGPYVERLFLEYFYRRGNRAKTIVYFIDPWALSSREFNEKEDFLDGEPLDADFMSFLVGRGLSVKTWFNYFRSKATPEWWLLKPDMVTEELRQSKPPDPPQIKKQIEGWYADGLSDEVFKRYALELRAIAEKAKDQGSRMIFIIPTTQIADLPGKEALKSELEAIRQTAGAEWYDHSAAIADPTLYFDDDHLNTAGILRYTEDVLKPILDSACRGR